MRPTPVVYMEKLETQGELFRVASKKMYCGLTVADYSSYIALEEGCFVFYNRLGIWSQAVWVIPFNAIKCLWTASYVGSTNEDTVIVIDLHLNSAAAQFINDCDGRKPLRPSHNSIALRVTSHKHFNFEAFDDFIDKVFDYAEYHNIDIFKTTWVEEVSW